MMLTRATVVLMVCSLLGSFTAPAFAAPSRLEVTSHESSDFINYVNRLKSDVSAGRLSSADAEGRLHLYFTKLAVEGKDVLSEVIMSLRLHSDLPGTEILIKRFEKAQRDLNRLKAKMGSEANRTMSSLERTAFEKRWEGAFISVLKPLQKDIENLSQTGSRMDDVFWLCAGMIGVPAIIGIVIGLIVYSSNQAQLGEKVEYATRKPVLNRDQSLANAQAVYDKAVSEIRKNQETAIAAKTTLQAEISRVTELKDQGAQTVLVGGIQVQIDTYLQTKRTQLGQVEGAIFSGDNQAIAAFDQYQKGLAAAEAQYQKDLTLVSGEIEAANKAARFWYSFGEAAGGGAVVGLFMGGIVAGCFGGY